ncbi:hypothetical protein ROZALSC1DRAFT_28734, partial [Rozella allomycis CSF55]
DFQKEIAIDISDNDALFVLAKGIGHDSIISTLLKAFASPQVLVFLVHASSEQEQSFISIFKAQGWDLNNFKCVNSDLTAKARSQMYEKGGVFSITSRILVMDLLKEHIPIEKTTGMLILNAHTITDETLEAFAMRLYRQKNKNGFIKAVTEKAEGLTIGFARLEKTLKCLYLTDVKFYPRYEVRIAQQLEEKETELIEINIGMTDKMKDIQLALIEVMDKCIRELAKMHKELNIEEMNVENGYFKHFDAIIKRQLDPIWHTVGLRSKQLMSDLVDLRNLIHYLNSTDCVTFYSYLETILTSQKMNEMGTSWVYFDAANVVFELAKERIVEKSQGKLKLTLEKNPKWDVLNQVLDEIKQETANLDQQRILILTQDSKHCRQLKKLLVDGPNKLLREVIQENENLKSQLRPILDVGLIKEPLEKKRKRELRMPEMNNVDLVKLLVEEPIDYESSVQTEDKEFKIIDEPIIRIQTFSDIKFGSTLNEFMPDFIILMEPHLETIRFIETFNATFKEHSLRIYLFSYEYSAEEQKYLTSVRREKDAFQRLIREKSVMAVGKEQDGKVQLIDDDDLTNVNTRIAGGKVEFEAHKKNIDIEPVTIEVGDYILTPKICVERKSIPDLISSLNTGRLYTQVEAMCRYYDHPIVLIEFDHQKAFSLQSQEFYSSEINSTSVSSKLALLILHFPKLRLIWSSGVYETVEIFMDLKKGQEQPDLNKVLLTGGDSSIENDESTNFLFKDILLTMPGVTIYNVRTILQSVKNLKDLSNKDLKSLKALIGDGPGEKECAYHHKIINDSHRTLKTCTEFKQKVSDTSITRVLNASVHLLEEVNKHDDYKFTYVQGMNVLLAPFIFEFGEAPSLFMFSKFIHIVCPTYVQPQLQGVHASIKLFDEIFKRCDEELYNYLKSKNISSQILAFAPLMTFSACLSPFDEVIKLWDYFMTYGFHLHIISFVCNIVKHREELLATKTPSNLLRANWPTVDASFLIKATSACAMTISGQFMNLLKSHMIDMKVCAEINNEC